MSSFRSVLIICSSFLLISFFVLDFFKIYTRYEFLVKGDVCLAFDRKEDALKVIGINGCVTVPMTKTMEQKMREQIEAEVSQKIQSGLQQLGQSQQTLGIQQPINPAPVS